MSKKNEKKIGVVYSTDPDFRYVTHDDDVEEVQTLPADKQALKVSLDRKHRGGKIVTLIDGFVGTLDDLKLLEKNLKNKCGVGGSSKEGAIIIQGDFKQKIIDFLKELGYTKTKGVGG